MKFLIDNNLSPLLAEGLKAAGHDAVHLRDLGMQAAPDAAVLQRARVDERVLVSADTDFGGLLSRSRATGPLVLLIRRLAGRRAAEQSAIILANLDPGRRGPDSRSCRGHRRRLKYGYAASQCLANPLRSATGRRCRIILRGINQGGALHGTAAPTVAGLCAGAPRPARPRQRRTVALDQSRSFRTGPVLHGPSSSAPIVQLAGTASTRKKGEKQEFPCLVARVANWTWPGCRAVAPSARHER